MHFRMKKDRQRARWWRELHLRLRQRRQRKRQRRKTKRWWHKLHLHTPGRARFHSQGHALWTLGSAGGPATAAAPAIAAAAAAFAAAGPAAHAIGADAHQRPMGWRERAPSPRPPPRHAPPLGSGAGVPQPRPPTATHPPPKFLGSGSGGHLHQEKKGGEGSQSSGSPPGERFHRGREVRSSRLSGATRFTGSQSPGEARRELATATGWPELTPAAASAAHQLLLQRRAAAPAAPAASGARGAFTWSSGKGSWMTLQLAGKVEL